jgi:uncharacterized membrane protein YfcA
MTRAALMLLLALALAAPLAIHCAAADGDAEGSDAPSSPFGAGAPPETDDNASPQPTPWTWSWRNWLGMLACALNAATGAATGQGGSQILVPIGLLAAQMSVADAAAFSAAVSAFGALPSLADALTAPHPLQPGARPIVDFPALALGMPALLVGVELGTLVNKSAPAWLLSLLLVLLYAWGTVDLSLSYRRRARRSAAEDGRRGAAATSALAPGSDSASEGGRSTDRVASFWSAVSPPWAQQRQRQRRQKKHDKAGAEAEANGDVEAGGGGKNDDGDGDDDDDSADVWTADQDKEAGSAAAAPDGAVAPSSPSPPPAPLSSRVSAFLSRRADAARAWRRLLPKFECGVLLFSFAAFLAATIGAEIIAGGACSPVGSLARALFAALMVGVTAVVFVVMCRRQRAAEEAEAADEAAARAKADSAAVGVVGVAAGAFRASDRDAGLSLPAAGKEEDAEADGKEEEEATAAAAPPPHGSGRHEAAVAFSPALAAATSPCALAVGCLGASVGASGSVIVQPVALRMGVHPQVVSATSKILLFVSAGASSLSLALAGRMNAPYALRYGLITLAFTPLGQWAADGIVQRRGRPSLIVAVNIARYTLGVVLLVGMALVPGLLALARGEAGARFVSPCGGDGDGR